jgi:hypothetical protein
MRTVALGDALWTLSRRRGQLFAIAALPEQELAAARVLAQRQHSRQCQSRRRVLHASRTMLEPQRWLVVMRAAVVGARSCISVTELQLEP